MARPAYLAGLAAGAALLLGNGLAQLRADSAPGSSNVPLPGTQTGGTNRSAASPPALPGTRTKADEFRELLAMTPAAQARVLAGRTAKDRQIVQEELARYEAMAPEEREARLEQLEISCHVLELMRLQPEQRGFRLGLVPLRLRPRVDAKLKLWDALPPKVQTEVLDYQTTANFFLRVRPAGAPAPARPQLVLPPGEDEAKRKKLADGLAELLELSPQQREKSLRVFPAADRDEMNKTLEHFSKLGPEARRACLASFDKFSQLTPEQRRQFLKNAERWKAMSPGERETWRTLVNILPPGGSAPAPLPIPLSSNAASPR